MGAISQPESNEVAFIAHAMLDEVCSADDGLSDDDDDNTGLAKALNAIVSSALDPHISSSIHCPLGSISEKNNNNAEKPALCRNVHARDKLAKLEYRATNGGFVSPDSK